MLHGFLAFIAIIVGLVLVITIFKIGFVISDFIEDKTDRQWLGFMSYMVWVVGWLAGIPVAVIVGSFT